MKKEQFKKINQNNYKQALKWIVKILKENNIKFNVVGGLAAYAQGSKRMLVDIDISVIFKDMKRLTKLAKDHVIEKPWNGTNSTSQWRGYYMELNYKGIAIEIGELSKSQYFNKKSGKWEHFPDDLKYSVNKKVFGLIVPVLSKKKLIDYKSKLRREVDLIDLKNLKN